MADEHKPSLFEAIIRHQLYLEGLKLGRRREFAATLLKIEAIIQIILSHYKVDNLGDLNKAHMAVLLRETKTKLWNVFTPEIKIYKVFLENFTAIDREHWISIFADVAEAPMSKLMLAPKGPRLYAAAANEPMAANGLLIEKFVEASRTSAVANVLNSLNQARANHETKQETVKRIVGTQEAQNRDGQLHRIANQQTAVTNTVLQHLSAQANNSVAKQVFSTYEWISILDDGTTVVCRGRNGKTYVYGEGPLPPAHVGCRSTVKPIGVNTGQVDYLNTFSKWAKATPDSVLKDIFKDGEPDVRNVKPLTLDEFKSKREKITE